MSTNERLSSGQSSATACACLALAAGGVLAIVMPANSAIAEPPAMSAPRITPATPTTSAVGGKFSATVYGLEADISMRNIPVDISFTGARLVIFGSANVSGQPVSDALPLDVVVVVEGARLPLTVRRKSRVWGLWLNTQSVAFQQAPKYYAIASTRSLDQVAPKAVLDAHRIGIEAVPIIAASATPTAAGPGERDAFREAAIARGVHDGQYVRLDHGIRFVGTSLFRGEIDLPANVPVGAFDVTVYLFKGGEVLTERRTHVTLSREGFENFIYAFAHAHAWIYGVATVLLAVLVGAGASSIAQRRSR